MNPAEQFRDALRAAGLTPPDRIEPGHFHRFPGIGKSNGNTAGWCKLFADERGGVFGDYASGLSEQWQAERDSGKQTQAERAAFREQVRKAQAESAAQRERDCEATAQRARKEWDAATPGGDDHPYLLRKGVRAHGLRVASDGQLLVPMRDAAGELRSLQRIAPDLPAEGQSNKRYLPGPATPGCYHAIGSLDGAAAICIVEGYVTGASVFEATGLPVAVAFDAGRLLAVAQALRAKFPSMPIVLCADDDHRTEGNPGLAKAYEAARDVRGTLAVPDFGPERADRQTDFNDMATARGPDAVRLAVVTTWPLFVANNDSWALLTEACHQTPESDHSRAWELSGEVETYFNRDDPGQFHHMAAAAAKIFAMAGPRAQKAPQSDDHDADDVPPPEPQGDAVEGDPAKPSSLIPALEDRPRFSVLDDWVKQGSENFRPGVWYFGPPDKEGNTSNTWICSPLHILAVTFDGQENNYGRLLRFRNTNKRWREWAMPMELLKGSGEELRGELLGMGVEIDPSPKARYMLSSFLQAQPPKPRMHCALQVGWCKGAFVLPDVVIGPGADGITFQRGERIQEEFTTAGTLEGWKSEIAAMAIGNPLLTMGLSASFAGPLLDRCHLESGGVHFTGDSSTGKTTITECAASTWGGKNYSRGWSATANGMEGAAAMFNDCLLVLDEINQANPREVGAIVYALANGTGKQRAGRTGYARAVTRWRSFVMSTGEKSIETVMAGGDIRINAGQAVRLLNLPAKRMFGVYDELHGLSCGAALSDALKRSVLEHHGHAGRAFLERLTRDTRDMALLLEQVKALPMFRAHDGQEKRAAARFALIGMAGELATEYGLTGWKDEQALEAAKMTFDLWRATRGGGNDEQRQVVHQVRDFIERHGDARFSNVDERDSLVVIRDRAGWWKETDGVRTYLLTAGGMAEAIKGFELKQALDVLQEVGALPPTGQDGKRQQPRKIAGRVVKVYSINPEQLEGNHGA